MNVFGDDPSNDGYQRSADDKRKQRQQRVADLAKRCIRGTGKFNR